MTLTAEGQEFPSYSDGRAEATMGSLVEETTGSRSALLASGCFSVPGAGRPGTTGPCCYSGEW
ncbi:hypothetical protein GCM10012287_57260 [Streptomyces daqingensis]|uniref:Uncharacterized protein n=1 Tax=Streptomyces daqingensis TaxID=1472640 RepID=A0ABQ2MVH9_9ACTN|nr:hypothetical protein GCM10012287_57260 [Streptomyces daqingensis]